MIRGRRLPFRSYSKEAARFLIDREHESVASLNGGMMNWVGAGMSTITDRGEQLTESCVCQLRPGRVYRTGSCC